MTGARQGGAKRQQVGAYPVVRFLGDGASASVYACSAPSLSSGGDGGEVVVKVLRPELLRPAARRDRLLHDVGKLRNIPSPYVGAFLDVGEDAGEIFVVRELLAGEDLQARLLRDGRVPVKEALRYARDATKGLRAAFAAGVAHGDVRPKNLVVDGRRLKITDFSMALPVGALSVDGEGRQGLLSTTAAYVAPEVIRAGGAVSDGSDGDLAAAAAADFYALGCTLFALLTGRPPFALETVRELLQAHQTETPPSLLALLPQSPPTLLNLMDALLAKDPAARPARHDDVVALIEAALDDVVASVATPVSPGASPGVAAPAQPRRRIEASATPAPVPFDDPFAAPPSNQNIVMGAPTGVVGALKQMNVVEIVQSLELGRKTAVVEVNPVGGGKGVIACRGGKVVYAECGEARGEAGFYALIGHTEGYFRIHYGDVPFEANISAPTQFLMLEALRRIDEGNVDADGVDDTNPTNPGPRVAPAGGASGFPRSPLPEEGKGERSDPFGRLPPTEASSAPRIRPAALRLDKPLERAKPLAVGEDFDAPTEALPTEALAKARADVERTEPSQQVTRPGKAGDAPSVNDLVTDLAELGQGLKRGWAGVIDGAYARAGSPPGLAPAQAFVRTMPGLAAVVAVAALPVIIVVALVSRGDFDPAAAQKDIEAGRAAAVLAEIDDVDVAERSGAEHLWRGHALSALALPAPAPQPALTAYLAAAKAGVVDERALQAVLAALTVDGATVALDALAAWPDAAVDERLRALLSGVSFNARQQARMALQERRSFTIADAEAIGITDLTRGRSCAERRMGLEMLVDKGVSDAVVEALQVASGNSDIIACLGRELSAGARAVSDRRKLQSPQ